MTSLGYQPLSRKAVPVSDHPLSKQIFPNVHPEPSVMPLKMILILPINGYQGKEISNSLSSSLFRKL